MKDTYRLVNAGHVLAEFESRDEAAELGRFMGQLHPDQDYRVTAGKRA